MLRCSLWLRMIDDCFSVVLWEAWVCLCLFVVLLFWDFAGMDGCIGELELVPKATFVGPEAELCEMDVAITGDDTWE